MKTSSESASIWRIPFILSANNKQAKRQDIKPTDSVYGVLDPKTYEAIEVDALFDVTNHTQTQIGELTFYRSLVHPISDAEVLRQKQEALREIETDLDLHHNLQNFIKNNVLGEESLYHLLYGEFSGGFSTDDQPISGSGKLEFAGCG